MEERISIVIADDHALIRKGLTQILDRNDRFTILEADNGEDALAIIREEQPQICILDIEMPTLTGFQIAQKVEREGIDVDIIFLTMHQDESLFNQAMDIGVKGFLLKENTVQEIEQCVDAVIAGNSYISPAISDLLIRRNQKLAAKASDKNGINRLTSSEHTILKLVADLKTNQEIAEELAISIKTVQNHRYNICKKLDISGSHALLKFAVEHLG
jgi:DNA-binding NarL/FixJ family response regulator